MGNERTKQSGQRRKLSTVICQLSTAILLLLVVLGVRQYVVGSYRLSTGAMEEALFAGDCILVNKLPIKGNPARNRVVLFTSPLLKDTVDKPLFISRLIGMPGDTIRISNDGFSVNGRQLPRSPRTLSRYRVDQPAQSEFLSLMEKLEIPVRERRAERQGISLDLTSFEAYQLREELSEKADSCFRQERNEEYTLVVPQKGRAYRLNPATLRACREAITAETDGQALFRDDKLYLDGKETTFFFFQQNYYWVLSDNTNEGIDSRHLGFVPAGHIVGNALFCWFSTNRQRIFKPVR